MNKLYDLKIKGKFVSLVDDRGNTVPGIREIQVNQKCTEPNYAEVTVKMFVNVKEDETD